jgi:hypothetical protein
MTITLKRAANCQECGARLPVGTRARWYRSGKVYGLECHAKRDTGYQEGEPLGLTYSRYDRYGIYAHDGTKLGSSCGCEDYPCCGH